MKSLGSSDKKIFYGLVILIVLTILLIVGITFIQRPQTTSSEAQIVPSDEKQIIDEDGVLVPTSVPLPGFNDDTDQSGSSSEGEALPPEQESSPTPTVNPSTQSSEGAAEENETNQLDPTLTPETTILETGTSETESETSESQTEPTPTDTLVADSGTGGTEYETGPGTSESTVTTQTPTPYSTSTPVPTAIEQLPTAGIAHIALLIFATSLLLVLLGLAL